MMGVVVAMTEYARVGTKRKGNFEDIFRNHVSQFVSFRAAKHLLIEEVIYDPRASHTNSRYASNSGPKNPDTNIVSVIFIDQSGNEISEQKENLIFKYYEVKTVKSWIQQNVHSKAKYLFSRLSQSTVTESIYKY